ncbi:MAG TPA: BatA domain-containing protein [Planctomycetota bacterium]|nr:BatA domain-containing protein [Planctomycetota bacterium]
MSFINPYILFGLVATAIPIILHILFRRRYKKVRWAAMQFLLRAYQQTRRSFILENLLLLILRILIVFFLILLFARPVARATRFLQITQTVDNYIVCMDTSYSMSLQSSNITPLENAKKHAHGILEKASIHDTFTLMTFNETTEAFIKFSSITNDKQKQNFAQKIDEIQITDMGTEPFCFVDTLLEWNQEFGYDNQHIYILSDFQKNAWEEVAKNSVFQNKLKQLKEKTLSMTLMDCQVSNPQNIGITKLESSGLLALQGNGRFIATIQNYGDKIYNEFSVNMYINGQKQGTEYVSLLPYKETEVVFSPSFTHAGQHSITIEIPADGLNHDNKRHLSFQVLDKINLLVVDGDPSDSVHRKFEGETDFFMAAVGTLSDSIIKPKKINIGNFTPDISFSDYDVVLLANVQNFATEQRYAELETFVQKGGGLNIWLGDKILPDLYHQYLYKIAHEILPAQIQNQTMGSEKEGQKTTFNITNVIDHPIWRYFHDNKKLMEDLKNLILSKNRLNLGKWNGEKFVKDEDLGKINAIFQGVEFSIDEDINKLINSRVCARNIIDKLLSDEKLT